MGDDFFFDYGVIEYEHRFSINRPLSDYSISVLSNCISINVEFVYKTMACDDLVPQVVILYRDTNFKSSILKLDLRDYRVNVVHLGDMRVLL